MAIKIKQEPISLDEDEEDEEALRLAALQSLKAKQSLKPAASGAACRPAAARPSGPPPYRAAPPYRPPSPQFQHRQSRQPFAAAQSSRREPLEPGFQRHVRNPNLIAIVPVSDDQPPEADQGAPHQKQGQRFRDLKLESRHTTFSKQTNVPSSVCTTAAENTEVPSKFSRIDASDSESDDDLLTKKKNCSEDEADVGDNDPDDTKNESDQSSNSEDDDSLEKLMEEMEQEMNRGSSDAGKTSKTSSKKPKKSKQKKKKLVSDASKQIPPNVIEQKVLNIKKEKENVEKVEPKPFVKTAAEKVPEPVNKPLVGIAKPTCIEPLKVKIKQEPTDPDDVKGSLSNAPKNNVLDKVVETSTLSPIRIRSPNEVNSHIETKSNPLDIDESKGKFTKSSPTKATCSKDTKLSPSKSTCSSPVECIERSPVSPITVDSPKSDRTDLLDEREFSHDKERSHPPIKRSRSPIHRPHSPDYGVVPRKFSRSPSPRTYRTSPGKHGYYHDSVGGMKSNGRTSPFERFPNKSRAQGDRSYSPYYTNNTYNSNYGPANSHYNHYSTSERPRSPFYSSRNYSNPSNHYSDEQNARYRGDESEEPPRYPPAAMSPRRRSRSPRRLSRSPRRWSRSPRRLSRSPRRFSRSPRRLSISPRRLSRSPRRLSRSPRRQPRSPRLQSRSPSPKSRSPKRYIPRPSRRRSPWNSRVPNQFSTASRCVSRSPTPHQTRDFIRRSSTSPKRVQHESKRSPGPGSERERKLSPHLREALSPRKPHSRSPVRTSKVGSPSRTKRASVSPSKISRRESPPRNFEADRRYRQRSLSPTQTHPESRHRQTSLSPKRKEPSFQKQQVNTFRRYSPGYKRRMPPTRYLHSRNRSRSPPRKTSPLQTQYKNPADKWERNWSSDNQPSKRAELAGQPPASKSSSPPAAGDPNRQRSRSPMRDGSDLKSRRRSPLPRRHAPRRDPVERNRDRDRRDRRRDGERERMRDRSREKTKAEHDKRTIDSERLETGTGKVEQESVQDKEPVINDPVMEARRRKFESNDLVQPVNKKICLKSKNTSNKVTDSPDVTHEEEETTTEAKLQTKVDDNNYDLKNDGEESDEMLDLDRYDKTDCITEDVLDLGADNLLWEDDPPDWNRKVEVSVNNSVPAKRSKEKVKDLRSKVSEKRRHKHKRVTDKACSPLVESSPVKKKKKKKETISVVDEPEAQDEEKEKEQEQSDKQLEDSSHQNEESEPKEEKIDDDSECKESEPTNEDCDLRAELSRRRAARLTKAGSLHESLPKRLLQSAFQGLIGRNRSESKGSKSKESKQTTVVQPKVKSLPKTEIAFEPGKRRVAELPAETGKRRVLLLKRNKPVRKASFQIGLKVTKESDSDSLPSYSEDESEENEDDSVDQSDSEAEDGSRVVAMMRKQVVPARLPVKCRLGSALGSGLKQKKKFFRRNQVRKSPSVNIDMHAPSSKKKLSIGLKTRKVGKSKNKLTVLY
ncbi:hypothetical protein LSTR_LSTR003839 [Laodelphax striatellus]|uniref:Uncharacterized protein n=1 Tax=Laodelphax striatellus TaxID=195883 RepID=A0A482XFD9_LAOST|nr:hypothetical protein LSTR_LSTR003839 [Laodelphax striatellus]